MDDSLDTVWKALADPTRRGLLDALRLGPRTTGDLAETAPALTRYAVMKHLTVLEEAGLVFHEKRGRERWNHLNAAPLRQIYDRWVSRFEDRLAGPLANLKAAVESRPSADRPTPQIHPDKETPMSTEFLKTPVRAAVVRTEISINAKPTEVYDAFVHRCGEWFYENEETRTATPSRMEHRVGGNFSMMLPNGGENLIATVTMLKPGWKIRLRGDCTMPNAFVANMTVTFHEAGAGTRVHVEHRMAGEFEDDLPAGFEEGWADGLSKLKALLESA